ncbi:LamG-like jellyroll fold domain-containing protein [Luteolibacter marinus]|uniref:LamG-like jellyroll fold domain-containing protein n=1 Tax=Luteolibacter marinus TaxID=2776705 RepID=UPI001868A61D|nr:LamG-like jellyroll fold domain-containing protein [Luteolibacter marinus]
MTWAPSTAVGQVPPASFTRTITKGAETVTVRFALHPIRSANFEVLVQQPDGTYLAHDPDLARTYLGTVDELPGALACGLLHEDGTLWARISLEDGKTRTTTGGDASVGGPDVTPAWPTTVVGEGGAGSDVRVAEVGIDSTFSHFTACGGSAAAVVAKCEFSVLCTDMIYLRDAAILHRIGKIVIRADAGQDPYAPDGGTTGELLPHVKSLWNAGVPMGTGHDVAAVIHASANGGLAWVGAIGTSNRYSANDSDGGGDFWNVWRHEVGHNWSSSHYEGGGNPEGTTIMSGNSLSRLSSPELRKVIAHRNAKSAILDGIGNYPFPLPPRANQDTAAFLRDTPVRIDVLGNDSDSNGEAISLLSFDDVSSAGGSLERSAGTGPGGRDEVLYTPPAGLSAGTDWFRYRIVDASGMQAVGHAMLRPRAETLTLADHWPLDDGSAANLVRATQDGSHENGVLGGQPGACPVTRGAAGYDGIDDQTTIPAPGYNTNTLTFTAWVKRDGPQYPFSPFIFTRAGSSVSGFHFGNANELRYTWNGSGHTWDSGLVVPDDTWCLVAMCVSPGGTTLHLRSPGGLQSATNAASQPTEAFNGTMYLAWDPNSVSRHYKGWLDDVRVYTSTLDGADIESLYQQALTPPAVTLTSPVAGSEISPLSVGFAASVGSLPELVDRVAFVEGSTVFAETSQPPYQATAFAIPPGAHTVTARTSYGDWGYQVDSAPVSFTVQAAPLPVVTVRASSSASKLGPRPGSFTIARDHPLGEITVPFATGGDAVAGIDYVAIPSSVTLPDGVLSQTIIVEPIAAAPDGLTESVVVSLSPDPKYQAGDPAVATLVIDDHITSIADGAWNAGTTWNDGLAAPVTGSQDSGEAYAVAHVVTSNNTGSNSQALVAGGLRIAAGGILDLARLHSTTEQKVTYNLPATRVENGGGIRFRCSVGTSTHTVAAALGFAGDAEVRLNGGSYGNRAIFSGEISGDGNIAVVSDSNAGATTANLRALSVVSADNPFRGHWSVSHTAGGDDFAALRAEAANALGTGTVTLGRRSRLTNESPAGLDSLSAVILNGDESLLQLDHPWNNPDASLRLEGGSPVVQVGDAASSIGELAGTRGIIRGSGASSSLTVHPVTDRTYAGDLGEDLAFTKAGPAALTLAGALDPGLALTLGEGELRFGTTAVTVGSFVQSGGNLVLPLSGPGEVPLTINGDCDWSGGAIIVELPGGPPAAGSAHTLAEYTGTLSGQPVIQLPAGLHAEVDYGSGENSRIRLSFVEMVELQVVASPAEGGEVTGGGIVEAGSHVAITATPASGWEFTGWTGAGVEEPGSTSTSVLVDAAKTVVAGFQQIDPYVAWAAAKGLEGADALKSADPDGDGMANGVEFLFDFDPADPHSRLQLRLVRGPSGEPLLVVNKVIPTGTFTLEWGATPGPDWEGSADLDIAGVELDFEVVPPTRPERCFYRLRYTAPST